MRSAVRRVSLGVSSTGRHWNEGTTQTMADLDLASLIKEADALPKLQRGKSSDEYDVLIDKMRDGGVYVIPNVAEAQKSKIGQKIRGAAAKAGFKVTVRHSKKDNSLYFQRDIEHETDEHRNIQRERGYLDEGTTTTKSTSTSKKAAAS